MIFFSFERCAVLVYLGGFFLADDEVFFWE